MKAIFKHTLLAVSLLASGSIIAQNLNGAYFMEGYAYGHELNPAKDYDRKGYVSMPLLGNMNFALRGNLGLKDFFYKDPTGKHALTTYLNPNISYDKAMDGFSSNNKLLQDLRLEFLSVGFHAFGGFNTFNLGLRENIGLNMPYELFDLTKKLTNKNYDISNFGASANAWAEMGFGHSRQLNEDWRVGGKVKILMGLARLNMKMENLSLNLADENKWTAIANAQVEASVKSLKWGATETKEYNVQRPGHTTYEQIDFDNVDVDNFGVNGGGLAFDLGTEWNMKELVEGMKLSASLLDLGFIKWKNTAVAYNRGEEFVFDGFENIQVKDGPGTKFEDQTDDLGDRLADLYSLQDGGTTSKTSGIGATLNIGLEYKLPAYDRLRFGFLSTTRIQGKYSWNEERISANVSPWKAFECGINAGVGTLGASFGWIINVHPKGFNLFAGMDHILGKLSKQGIPLKSNADFTIGINFPFGKSSIE